MGERVGLQNSKTFLSADKTPCAHSNSRQPGSRCTCLSPVPGTAPEQRAWGDDGSVEAVAALFHGFQENWAESTAENRGVSSGSLRSQPRCQGLSPLDANKLLISYLVPAGALSSEDTARKRSPRTPGSCKSVLRGFSKNVLAHGVFLIRSANILLFNLIDPPF